MAKLENPLTMLQKFCVGVGGPWGLGGGGEFKHGQVI